jgi:hypothetical protein
MLALAVLALAAVPQPALPHAIVLSTLRPVVRELDAPGPSALSLEVRGRSCSGAPRLVVTVDGKRIVSQPVRGRRWRTVAADAAVAAGPHTVRLRLANPRRTAKCRRDLRIRGLRLVPRPQRSPVAPAPPGIGPAGSRWAPAARTTWQWQLSGALDQGVPADMYDVDLFDTPPETVAALHAQGRRVTCYLDAGTFEPGRPDAADFPAGVLGSEVAGWPGERWLDIRSLDALASIIRRRMDLCASKGFDAVEADNVDGHTHPSGFPLTAADQLAYNRFLASEAHARRLAIALKNDFGQAAELAPDFDFALTEQCYEFGTCDRLAAFTAAGKAVLDAEYAGDPAIYCPRANADGPMAMAKNLSLDAWRQPCW